jgi:hypothetical protein
MNWDTMQDHCERIAKTTKEHWDATPLPVTPAVQPRLSLLAIRPRMRRIAPHKEQRHA